MWNNQNRTQLARKITIYEIYYLLNSIILLFHGYYSFLIIINIVVTILIGIVNYMIMKNITNKYTDILFSDSASVYILSYTLWFIHFSINSLLFNAEKDNYELIIFFSFLIMYIYSMYISISIILYSINICKKLIH